MRWQDFTRAVISKDKSWKPCICIQGGGAKGAWEGGVLAELLGFEKTNHPVAIWGTSAGAINALWATTLSSDDAPGHLCNLWCCLSQRIIAATIIIVAFILMVLWIIFKAGGTLGLLGLVTSLFVLSCVMVVSCWVKIIERMPGLIPVTVLARLLPVNDRPARWYSYFCAADAKLNSSPTAWDWDSLSCFVMKPKATLAELYCDGKTRLYDTRTAVMTSSALPVLCRAFDVGNRALLDGGFESNLPAGHIKSQGMSGGNCAICIIPRQILELNPNNHVDYRVIRFLSDMKKGQSNSRINSENTVGTYSCAAHTNRPVLVITPTLKLKSGLLTGFFRPSLLREEFEQGRTSAKALIEALRAFEDRNDDALQDFLLEHQNLPPITDTVPKTGCCRLWLNTGWH